MSDVVVRLAALDGTIAHPWFRHLASGTAQRQDLTDAVHCLCALHGDRPGMADDALAHDALPEASGWLGEVAGAFAAERAHLARLTAAAGPLPSTPGHGVSDHAIRAQGQALALLARSDRAGCATGAVAALLLDWHDIRLVLDEAADRFAVAPAPCSIPTPTAVSAFLARIGNNAAAERAMGFGAQQLLAQHRGLWSLLEARAGARRG